MNNVYDFIRSPIQLNRFFRFDLVHIRCVVRPLACCDPAISELSGNSRNLCAAEHRHMAQKWLGVILVLHGYDTKAFVRWAGTELELCHVSQSVFRRIGVVYLIYSSLCYMLMKL